MIRYSLLVAVVVFAVIGVDARRSMSADEKQIRDLIAAEDAGKAPPRADDHRAKHGRPPLADDQAHRSASTAGA